MKKNLLFKTENIFLILCLLWGLIFICVNPPFQSPDEPEHFFKMWGYTQGTYRYQIKDNQTGLCMPQSIAYLYQFYNVYRLSNNKIPYKATLQSLELPLGKDTTTFLAHTPTSYTPVSYFPSFIVLWLMKHLKFKPLFMMYILRFCSLLVYLALMYCAIKIVPCQKLLFCFFAMLPVNISQASSISTDGLTLGIVMLYLAYTFKLAFDDSKPKIHAGEISIWSGLITLISLLKFAYFPLILLYFLIPDNKFKTAKAYYINFCLIALINIFITGLFLIPIVNSPLISTYGMTQHFINKSILIKEIITSPVAYTKTILLSTIFLKNFLYQNMISSIGVTLAMIPLKYTHLAWAGLICAIFYKNKKEKCCDIKLKNKLWIFTAVVLSYVIIMTSVYLIYQTKPYIVGIQGRYLTALIPVFLLLFYTKKLRMQSTVIPIGLFVISQCLMIQNLITLVLRYY